MKVTAPYCAIRRTPHGRAPGTAVIACFIGRGVWKSGDMEATALDRRRYRLARDHPPQPVRGKAALAANGAGAAAFNITIKLHETSSPMTTTRLCRRITGPTMERHSTIGPRRLPHPRRQDRRVSILGRHRGDYGVLRLEATPRLTARPVARIWPAVDLTRPSPTGRCRPNPEPCDGGGYSRAILRSSWPEPSYHLN